MNTENDVPSSFFSEYLVDLGSKIKEIDVEQLKQCVDLIHTCVEGKGKIIVVGNGGSAAIASHVSVDFMKAAGVRSINFNEADLLTCFANDFGYENWVAKAIEFYADPNDLVVLISSSGKSPNIINGAKVCLDMGLKLITLSGFKGDNPLREFGDVSLWVDSDSYNFVEMTHHIWLLALVDAIISER